MTGLQTHGRTGQYHPHLHRLAPSGGEDGPGDRWEHLQDLPSARRRRQWQWPLLTLLRQTLQTEVIEQLGAACCTPSPDGVVTNVPKGRGPSPSPSVAR